MRRLHVKYGRHLVCLQYFQWYTYSENNCACAEGLTKMVEEGPTIC